MTKDDYSDFVTTVQDMVYLNDLERLMADQPRRVAA